MDVSVINYNSEGLVPAVTQDMDSGEVLMLAYMNKEAVEKTLSTARAHYYSRSRKQLWMKGETSGNIQQIEGVYYDCDSDAILLMVRQRGAACHTGEKTCFFRRLDKKNGEKPTGAWALAELFKTIKERKKSSPDSSYVASLYAKGTEKIIEKIKEESEEFIEAARKNDKKEIVRELVDVWFHTLVLLGEKEIEVGEIFKEVKRRMGKSGIEEKKSRGKKLGET